MFENHFGLRENPFVAGHQHRFVYPSPEHLEALAHLRYGIENREPFVLITGEVGTGKTTALYDALSEWESRVVVALITNSALTRAELLEEIALRFGVVVAPGSSKPQIMTALERHLLAVRAKQHRAILLLDEAQNLERELLEEIRLLSNLENGGDNLLQVVLVGQPELEEKLSRAELRQLRQRITVHYRLSPLSADDTERYIQHRVTVAGGHALTIFPAESCRAIHRLTGGIPREINHLAAQSLLTAYVEDSPCVRVEHVESAAHEIEFKSVSRHAVPRGVVPAPEPAPAAPPRAIVAPTPAPAPPAPPMTPAPPARATAPEGAPRTASSDAWEAWMSAIGSTPAAGEKSGATAPPTITPAAFEPPPPPAPPVARAPEPPAPRPAPPPRASEPPPDDFAARLSEAVSAAESDAPAPRAEQELPTALALPARLREKLEQAEAESERARRSPLPWLIAAAVVAALVITAVLWLRFRGGDHAVATVAPAPAAAPVSTPAESTATATTTSDSAATTPAAAETTKTAAALPGAPVASAPVTPPTTAPEPQPRAPDPTPARSATLPPAAKPAATVEPTVSALVAAKPAVNPMRYGVAVHTFLVRERADAERARLAGASGLAARVFPVKDGGSDAFRVVLGSWPDFGGAQRGASDLIRKGLVDEARVVPIGRAPNKAQAAATTP